MAEKLIGKRKKEIPVLYKEIKIVFKTGGQMRIKKEKKPVFKTSSEEE